MDLNQLTALQDALGVAPRIAPPFAPKPLVFVVSGPATVGKDAAIARLRHARGDISFRMCVTTRSARPDEQDGIDHYYRNEHDFVEMLEKGELVEAHRNKVSGHSVGLPKHERIKTLSSDNDVVFRMDLAGASAVRTWFRHAIYICIVPESESSHVKWILHRYPQSDLNSLISRVSTAREELNAMPEFNYLIINQDGCLDRTVSSISSIIDAEKARVRPKSATMIWLM